MIKRTILVLVALTALLTAACGLGGMESGDSESGGEHGERVSRASEGSGEHGGKGESEGSESGSENGEEDATQYVLGDTFDQLRAGSRLIVSYDADTNAFAGTVQNTTEDVLSRVRVEIHLSNGVELGPTPSVDLAPGEAVDVRLEATTQPFETWSAHAEVGGGGEGGGEGEESSERGGESEREGSREHGRGG